MQKETSREWLSENRYGICRLSLLTIYREPVIGSGMTSQLLFGETYEVSRSSKNGQWLFIVGQNRAGTGWIMDDQHHEVSLEEYNHFQQAPVQMTTSLISKVKWGEEWLFLLPGSQIHADENEIFSWNESFTFEGSTRPFGKKADRKELVKIAGIFLHAPYLSGGRSYFGLFGGSWLHLVFKISGYTIPNYLSPILDSGKNRSKENIEQGDVIVFGNPYGIPDHLALYIGNGKMMEVKGKVMISDFEPEKWVDEQNNSKENRVLHVKNLMKQ
jgi:gamma-D-glutamyl-L-lysine dipeptidyl-peptidase